MQQFDSIAQRERNLYHAASKRLTNTLESKLAVDATAHAIDQKTSKRLVKHNANVNTSNLEYVTVRMPFSGHFVNHVMGNSNTLPL